jgi:cytoplasmic iron level regulating protein YaaA (DUF328/UPF0246 family)
VRRIVLLSCVSKKKEFETTAANLYDSTLFNYAFQYAKTFNPDKIYIISALYGLLETDEIVKPYNKTLNEMNKRDRIEWSNVVLEQMRDKELDLKNDHFVILAGNNYRKYLLQHMVHYELPLEGKRIGEQLSFLKRSVQS